MRHFFLFALLITAVSCTKSNHKKWLVDYVDPLIGTAPSTTISAIKHGHGSENNAQVIPSVTVPFGMTNWTPQTSPTEEKCVAPYYYTDSIITGFRGTHWLSGSCVQDYGSMTIMPITGHLVCKTEERGSHFQHIHEKSSPYKYQVQLDDYGINAEVTASKRCGILRFTYNKASKAHIIINPNSDEGQGFIQIFPEKNEIVGFNPVHRIYQGWGEPAGFNGYFVVRFKHKIKDYGIYQGDKVSANIKSTSSKAGIGAYISFDVNKNESIEVCIGTSFTSIEEARLNLNTEIADKTFDNIEDELKHNWEHILRKVQVEGENENDKVKFYTALYHSFLQPRTFNDIDGSYVSFSGGIEIINAGDNDYFVDFSMWDTYRASHPLFNLLMPKQNANMMYSLINKGEQGGWLPIFPCWNSYTSAMIGDHVLAAIGDAVTKDVVQLSNEQYQLLLQNAFKTPENYNDYKNGKGRRALKSYLQYGYIPLEDSVIESFHKNEQVSRTLEYAYDDFTLAQIALKIGDNETADILLERALNYKNVYSVTDSCVRGKYANQTFTDDFNKLIRESYITEGTPWQYTWYVPHDIQGLINLMGGNDNFNHQLDHFHNAGQYWHGNEPGHQIPFLYNFSGQPWKTQRLVTQIMNDEYSADLGGLSGNDDAGQMSAWYVFAALGFYPVCPSVPQYVISGPHFDKITIDLDNGKTLTITAKGASSGLNYIQKITLNGKDYTNNFFNHFDITNGGTIAFTMGSEPNKSWGAAPANVPYSLSKTN